MSGFKFRVMQSSQVCLSIRFDGIKKGLLGLRGGILSTERHSWPSLDFSVVVFDHCKFSTCCRASCFSLFLHQSTEMEF